LISPATDGERFPQRNGASWLSRFGRSIPWNVRNAAAKWRLSLWLMPRRDQGHHQRPRVLKSFRVTRQRGHPQRMTGWVDDGRFRRRLLHFRWWRRRLILQATGGVLFQMRIFASCSPPCLGCQTSLQEPDSPKRQPSTGGTGKGLYLGPFPVTFLHYNANENRKYTHDRKGISYQFLRLY